MLNFDADGHLGSITTGEVQVSQPLDLTLLNTIIKQAIFENLLPGKD